MITETEENQTQTGLKNFKPKINLNHNTYILIHITACLGQFYFLHSAVVTRADMAPIFSTCSSFFKFTKP